MTRRLLELRDIHRALASGDYRPIKGTGEAVYVYLRSYEDERFLVAINTTGRPASFGIPETGAGEVVLGTTMHRHGPVDVSSTDLAPNEGLMVRLEGTISPS